MALASRRIKQFELDPQELERQVAASLGQISEQDLHSALIASVRDIKPGSIVQATVDSVDERTGLVVMDIGGKSEGSIPLAEFGDVLPKTGESYEVFYDGLDENDTAQISKRRADRLRAWERVSKKYREGDEVQGVVQRKIKGGLLVDVEGVNVFLPASQVNLRRTHDISDFLGEPIRARIIKVDADRMNIVISRRKLLEEERQKQKEILLDDIQEGQVRTGTIKNIADFGVFVDLGGIDGLLHITDMTWGRINHPSELVQLDQQIEVKVLRVDRERERIALGLKQKQASPWEGIESRYPVASKHVGEVVNIMSYGAFVKLEDGVEGLVHISEMSWTRRVNHPSELVKVSDKVEVVVLEYNKEKQEISLGMKQAETNPWDLVEGHYPVGTIIEGTVRNLTSYGAFIEIEEGIDGLLHVTDMSWTKKITHPSEMVKKGDKLRCVVLSVDTQKKRIALGLKQLSQDPWMDQIPANYHVGDLLTGYVTKITNFGAFVKLEEDLEGLLHVSELSDHKISSPEEIVKPGQKIEVRVIRVDTEERKIGLSFVHADFEENKAILEEHERRQRAAAEAAAKAPPEAPPGKQTQGKQPEPAAAPGENA
jgi:small subunit ribosomal protein S1